MSDFVRSPCISVCRIDPFEGVCIGCFRTIEEVAAWPEMSADAKRELLAKLPARKAARPAGQQFQLPKMKLPRL